MGRAARFADYSSEAGEGRDTFSHMPKVKKACWEVKGKLLSERFCRLSKE